MQHDDILYVHVFSINHENNQTSNQQNGIDHQHKIMKWRGSSSAAAYSSHVALCFFSASDFIPSSFLAMKPQQRVLSRVLGSFSLVCLCCPEGPKWLCQEFGSPQTIVFSTKNI